MTAMARSMLFALAFGLLACVGNVGHAQAPVQPKTITKKGLVIVAGGVGKLDVATYAARWALPRAGIMHDIQDFDWSHGRGKIFKDLQDTKNCLYKADELAAHVMLIKAADPERPIYFIGKSGGTGLVLAAAEQLPPRTLERIILLSAAVSPTYDLRPALRATRREVISFYSPYDRVILGWGTSQFGTMDRFYGPSAGLKSFVVPKDLSDVDQDLYRRLVQYPWSPRMILEGNTGGHLGTSMPRFFEKEVAPWLRP